MMKIFTTSISPLLLSATACVALAVVLLPSVSGSAKFRSRIPNGFNVPNVPAVGHSDPEGLTDDLNAFGKAFEKAGNKWTVALCQADSDGDGQTNGQELGDPCCEWTTGATPLWSEGLSDPGVKTSVADATLWSSLSCTTSGSSTTTTSSSTTPASTTKSTSSPSTNSSSTSTTKTTSAPTSTPAATTASSGASGSTFSMITLALASGIAIGAIAAARD